MAVRGEGMRFVLSGPSGVGKGALRERVDLKDLAYSISCTTRKRRPGEQNGVDYRFISERDFDLWVKQGLFLEHAEVHGYQYGTLRSDVERMLKAGRDVIVEVDVQGALNIRRYFPNSVLIFVAPPSLEELEQRLKDRGTESDKEIELRVKNAGWELKQQKFYDHVIINDSLDDAVLELRNIILKARLKKSFRER